MLILNIIFNILIYNIYPLFTGKCYKLEGFVCYNNVIYIWYINSLISIIWLKSARANLGGYVIKPPNSCSCSAGRGRVPGLIL